MAFKVGEDIDAWCTKCRTDTLHVVVALKPGVPEPKRVECKECHGQHMYRAPKIGAPAPVSSGPAVTNRTAEARAPKPPKVAKSPKDLAAAKVARAAKVAASTAHTLGAREWIKRMDEFALQHDLVMRGYSMRETFTAGEPIQHPKFGKGIVVEIVDTHKVAILFEEGRKVLAMGATPSA